MMLYFFIFIFGTVIGSFLNVCIYRLPEGLSVVSPASRCPACNSPIRFYDNIPIISYIMLGGKCRACDASVPLQYPMVEFINGALYLLLYYRLGPELSWPLAIYMVFVSVLVVIFFIDLEHQIIPNSITYPAIPLALIAGAIVMPDPFNRIEPLGFKSALIGMLSGGGSFYLIAVLGKAIFRKDAMGGGDIKMMAMAGGLIGWKGILVTTFLASLMGSIIGVSMIALKGREFGSKIPFGPYLAMGIIVTLLWGEEIWRWYLY